MFTSSVSLLARRALKKCSFPGILRWNGDITSMLWTTSRRGVVILLEVRFVTLKRANKYLWLGAVYRDAPAAAQDHKALMSIRCVQKQAPSCVHATVSTKIEAVSLLRGYTKMLKVARQSHEQHSQARFQTVTMRLASIAHLGLCHHKSAMVKQGFAESRYRLRLGTKSSCTFSISRRHGDTGHRN